MTNADNTNIHNEPGKNQSKSKNKSFTRQFLLGVTMGFLACTAAGAMLSSHRIPVANFTRFHEFINPNGGFYLTYSQMLAEARQALADNPNKPLVIIGGDSVFYGEGQSSKNVWTKYLQQELGDKYTVINLALPGTKVFEAGYWVYEKLYSEGAPVVLITDALPSTVFEPTGSIPMHYMYFDARERNGLQPYEKREEFAVKNKQWTLFKDPAHVEKYSLRAKFNHYLNAEELWTHFTYSIAGTFYHRTTMYNSLLPRKDFGDPFADRPPFNGSDAEKLDLGVGQVRHFMHGIVDLYEADKKTEYDQFFWKRLEACTDCSVPQAMRPNIAVCVTEINPLFINDLKEKEKEQYFHLKKMWVENFERAGFTTWLLNEKLGTENYVDFDHLSVDGGKTMAKDLAVRIKDFVQKRVIIKH